jgi:hypothetical protein
MADNVRSFSTSVEVLSYLQRTFGTADYSAWQTLRYQFYSFVPYPVAGATTFNFFGNSLSGNFNLQLTNMPKASSFGQQYFWLKQISTGIYSRTLNVATNSPLDVNHPGADMLLGFMNAGVGTLTINSLDYLKVPKPFKYMPQTSKTDSFPLTFPQQLLLAEGAPNTLSAMTLNGNGVEIQDDKSNAYLVDPGVFIEAEQSFQFSINYPSGAIPIIASNVWNAEPANQLYIGVIFDGVLYRPQS